MPKTPDEIIALAESWTFDLFLEGVGCTREIFLGFATNGIPEDWADVLAAQSKGRLPLSIWPKIIHRPRVLTHALTSVNTNEMTNFDDVVRKKFGSNAKLAAALNISPALLSRARTKGPKGRAIRESIAQKIEKLTGWPADKKHWPNGFVAVKN